MPWAWLLALLLALPLAAPGPDRAWLQPLTGEHGSDVRDLWRYETRIRDADYEAAAAVVPDEAGTVLGIDVYPPRLLVPFEPWAGRIRTAYTPVHDVLPLAFEVLAAGIEANGTWSVIEVGPGPMNQAVRATYADCRVAAHGLYEVIAGAGCAGRAAALEAAWRERHPDY